MSRSELHGPPREILLPLGRKINRQKMLRDVERRVRGQMTEAMGGQYGALTDGAGNAVSAIAGIVCGAGVMARKRQVQWKGKHSGQLDARDALRFPQWRDHKCSALFQHLN